MDLYVWNGFTLCELVCKTCDIFRHTKGGCAYYYKTRTVQKDKVHKSYKYV